MDQELIDIIVKVLVSALGLALTLIQGSKWLEQKKQGKQALLWTLGEMAVTAAYRQYVQPIKASREAAGSEPKLTQDERTQAMFKAVQTFGELARDKGLLVTKEIGGTVNIEAYLENVLRTVKGS